jgi:predicted transcriptional regulator
MVFDVASFHKQSSEVNLNALVEHVIASTLTPPMTPARALKSLMEDHNISQSDLAGKLKTSQSVISEFLTGKRGLSSRTSTVRVRRRARNSIHCRV